MKITDMKDDMMFIGWDEFSGVDSMPHRWGDLTKDEKNWYRKYADDVFKLDSSEKNNRGADILIPVPYL